MTFAQSIRGPLNFIFVCWGIWLLEHYGHIDLSYLGIHPRRIAEIWTIFTGPFVHGDVFHILSNSPTFVVLATAVVFFYPNISTKIFLSSYLLTGLGVWLFARDSYHIGCSGLIYAFASYLFFSGLFRKDARALSISMGVAVLYNGMLYGIFPGQPHISYESHLIGGLVGMCVAFYYRKVVVFEPIPKSEVTAHFIDYTEGYRNIETDRYIYMYKENHTDDKPETKK